MHTARCVLQLSSLFAVATSWVAPPRCAQPATASSRELVVSFASGPMDPTVRDLMNKQNLDAQLFNVNVGFAIDTLRTDIPEVLTKSPDLSIFSEDVRVSDPSGEKFRGKALYSQMYRAVRGLASVALKETSTVTTRLFFDKETNTLRTKINAQLFHHGMSNTAAPMHLDVVSTYTFDAKGKVNHHTIDRLDLDGRAQDPLSFMNTDTAQLTQWLSIPRGVLAPPAAVPAGVAHARNAERVPPSMATPQVLEWQEQELDVYGNVIPPQMRGKKGADAPKAKNQNKGKGGFFDWIKSVQPETCEDDFDCPAAMRCCDFAVTQVCCAGGIGIFDDPAVNRRAAPAPVYIPVPADDGFPSPPPPQSPI